MSYETISIAILCVPAVLIKINYAGPLKSILDNLIGGCGGQTCILLVASKSGVGLYSLSLTNVFI